MQPCACGPRLEGKTGHAPPENPNHTKQGEKQATAKGTLREGNLSLHFESRSLYIAFCTGRGLSGLAHDRLSNPTIQLLC